MSQELQIVLCYSCQTYQTQILKKSNKWICKICNEKQSLKKVFGQGSGTDCRKHCQKLNELRAKQNTEDRNLILLALDSENSCFRSSPEKEKQTMSSGGSIWAKYLSQSTNSNSDSDVEELDEEMRPSQFFVPKSTPESIDIPFCKKLKNDFGHSLGVDNDLSLNRIEDHDFDINILDTNTRSISMPIVDTKRKLSQGEDCGARDKFSKKKSSDVNSTKLNFDLFVENLIEDTDFEEASMSDAVGKCASVSESKSRGSCNFNANSNKTVKSYTTVKTMRPQSNNQVVFKMVPSNNLAIENLQKHVSLLEDINSYTVDQLTEMCKF